MCARRRCHFHLWRSRDAVCASLATEVATTATSNPAPPLSGLGAHCDQWAAILHGKSDDARDGAPALARSHVRVPARGAIGAHAYADTCLRSRCAGDTPSNDMAITAIITGVAAVVNAAAPPLLVAAAVPAQLVLMAAFVRAVRDPAVPGGGGFARILCGISLGIALGVCEGWGGRSGALQSTLVGVCMPLLECLPRRAKGCEQFHSQFGYTVEIWWSDCSYALY